MKVGQIIKVRAYGGEELSRQIVRIDNDVVVVCRSEEYEKAKSEGREPVAVGFRVKDIIDKSPFQNNVRDRSY